MTTPAPTPPATVLKHGPCPVCGTYSLNPQAQSSALLGVCDVLVIRALETVGKRIVRVDRSRYQRLGGKPWHLAHTIWQPEASMIDKALLGAWDVVPPLLDVHGCCGITSAQVAGLLDQYCRDLLITQTGHDVTELRYRFEAFLGLVVPPHPTERDHAPGVQACP